MTDLEENGRRHLQICPDLSGDVDCLEFSRSQFLLAIHDIATNDTARYDLENVKSDHRCLEMRARHLQLSELVFILSLSPPLSRKNRCIQYCHLKLANICLFLFDCKGKATSDEQLKFALQLAALVELSGGAITPDLSSS